MAEHAPDDHASIDEAVAALEQLGTADKVRLEKIARNRVRGLRHVDWTDVLQEAIARIIEGTRKWPRQVPLISFLAGVMRSIANEHWEQHSRTAAAGIVSEVDAQPFGETVSGGIVEAVPSGNPGPDRELEAKRELEAIEELFTDDEDALAIVMARAEGYSQSILHASDEDIAEETRSAGRDSEAVADQVGSLIQSVIKGHRQKKLRAAQEGYRQSVTRQKRRSYAVPNTPAERRVLLDNILSNRSNVPREITMAFREGGQMSEDDVISILEDLAEFGFLGEEDEGGA